KKTCVEETSIIMFFWRGLNLAITMIMLGHRALGITLTVYSSCWMDTGTVPSFFSYCDL
ncbi:hypothetical protein P692DRAFT_20195530, partial [Suillus brevipes Sb2]